MCLIETGSGCWGLANYELSVRLKAEKPRAELLRLSRSVSWQIRMQIKSHITAACFASPRPCAHLCSVAPHGALVAVAQRRRLGKAINKGTTRLDCRSTRPEMGLTMDA
jgi:hypothetical protein